MNRALLAAFCTVGSLFVVIASAQEPMKPLADKGQTSAANSGAAGAAQVPARSEVDNGTTTQKPSKVLASATSSDINGKGRPSTPTIPSAEKPGSEELSLTEIYRVGAGDVIDIRIKDLAAKGSTLFTVMEGGFIDFPVVGGSVSVAGLTTNEIQARLVAEFKRRALQDAPEITVGVRQYASHSIAVTGLVVSGGTKILRREAVPLYVILAETQARLDAARASIMRVGRPALVVDLNDPASSNILILPGDVINIKARPEEFYYIGGRIGYPGQKVFQPGMTLMQSILAAGGLRNPAEGIIEVSREGTDGNLATTRFVLREIKSGRTRDPRLQAGDRIEVIR